MNQYDGLTSYCLEGAFDMLELSSLSLAVAYYVPKSKHMINFDGIADDSSNLKMQDTHSLALRFGKNSTQAIRSYIASHAKAFHLDWLFRLTQRIAMSLIDSVEGYRKQPLLVECFPVYSVGSSLPQISSLPNLLNIVVVENAISVHLDSYLGDFLQESEQFIASNDSISLQAVYSPEEFAKSSCGYCGLQVKKSDPDCSRKEKKTLRKAIARGIKMFSSLLGGDAIVKTFISGGEVFINGNIFDYTIVKNRTLLKSSVGYRSIPYKLSVFDKKCGFELATICVYFEDTPILDQLYGFLMYISAGKEYEEKLLVTANAISITKFGLESSQLLHYFPQQPIPDSLEEFISLPKRDVEKDLVVGILELYIFKKLISQSLVQFNNNRLNAIVANIVRNNGVRSLSASFEQLNVNEILNLPLRSGLLTDE